MAFDFPSNPADGQLYTSGGATYQWNGFAWVCGPLVIGQGAVPISGGVMTGPLILSEDPTDPLGAATKQYVDDEVLTNSGQKVDVAGDTMTGALILSEHPTITSPALQAATKGYIDSIGPGGPGLPTGGLEGQALGVNAAGIATWGAPIFGDNF